jgi:ParB family transcriptional regulator, chromosome partitioning protein
MDIERLDLDLHRLELRFAGTRLAEPRAVERIARSIEQCGQLVPCIAVVAGDGGGFVLIDGYRRIAALRCLGRDTATIEGWRCGLAEALIGVLRRSQGRSFEAIEEASLLGELVGGLGLSQHEVARRCGRDASWVNRRLALLSGLPEAIVEAVRQGSLSSWSATRVFGPLARANGGHADRLLAALASAPLSTRDLGRWFTQYQKASRVARERMVEQPRLLLDALRERDEQRADAKLRAGPEGACAADVQIIEAVMARLRKRLAGLRPMPDFLRLAAERLRATMSALTYEIERLCDDPERDQDGGADTGGARPEPACDRPGAGPGAEHGAAYSG